MAIMLVSNWMRIKLGRIFTTSVEAAPPSIATHLVDVASCKKISVQILEEVVHLELYLQFSPYQGVYPIHQNPSPGKL
jgi:hypothetical protein